ncbi:MAG TPA: DUF5777 family beta-barrel protein [Bacteroidia bacterium]|nr:DUF5777 family beta-barrel protein [Bacteroidia bacterium]
MDKSQLAVVEKFTQKIFKKAFFLLLTLASYSLFAQEDLLSKLENETMSDKPVYVLASFKGDKIINIQTNETVKKNNLDVRVNHLFGNIGKESGGGFHNLYGFDQSQDIRIAFHYGITDKLMAGLSRSKRNENFEGLLKFKLLQQTTDNKIPLSLTIFGNATYSARSGSLVDKDIHRLTYNSQVIISRKFSPKFSLVLTPSYLHRNFVEAEDENDIFSIGGGFRIKLTQSTSLIADYFHSFRPKISGTEYFAPLGIGIEIETGGHVFSIMFTNASGILENDYLVNTVDDWAKGGIKFSFIVSRMFKFGKS